MTSRLLSEAFERYTGALDAAARCELAPHGVSELRRHVQEAKRRMLEQIDAAERRALGGRSAEVPAVAAPRRIIVAVDDSDPEWALRVAASMADREAAVLVIVHVIDPFVAVTPEVGYVSEDVRRDMRRGADDLLARAAARVPPAVTVETLVREGVAGDEIVAAAREWRADVVVLGRRGRGRLATFLLGSSAEHVIRHAHCPVVTVGHDPDAVVVEPSAQPRASRNRRNLEFLAEMP